MLNGWKTYIGGAGLILIGIGSLLTHQLGYVQAATDIALGLVAVGARSFGQKILDVLQVSKS